MTPRQWAGLCAAVLTGTLSVQALAATCSCAGVPLSSADAFVAQQPGDYQASLTYNHHDLNDLVAGSERIYDETRRDRTTETLLLGMGYGLADRWTLNLLFSQVNHRREVGTSNAGRQTSSGIGDSLVSLSYSPSLITVFERQQLTLGLGVRVPTGTDDNGEPLFLEDMQPGQGAWGGNAWVYWARAYSPQARWKTFASLSHSETGANDREYSFEGETTLTGGVSYSSDIGLALSASLDWRRADAHTRFGDTLPNTGGRWVNANLSAQYTLTPSIAVSAGVVLPVHRDLNGSLQFTTRRQVSLGVVYLFES